MWIMDRWIPIEAGLEEMRELEIPVLLLMGNPTGTFNLLRRNAFPPPLEIGSGKCSGKNVIERQGNVYPG